MGNRLIITDKKDISWFLETLKRSPDETRLQKELEYIKSDFVFEKICKDKVK